MTGPGLDDAVRLRFFLPPPALTPYVTTIYLLDTRVAPGEVIEDWLHPEWANIRFTSDDASWEACIGAGPCQPLSRFAISGPTSQAIRFRFGSLRSWGIGLLPLGWARLIGVDASRYADRVTDGADDDAFAAVRRLAAMPAAATIDPAEGARWIGTALLDALAASPRLDDEDRIRSVHAALVDLTSGSVADLAKSLGLSQRSLERLSRRIFGFPPKLVLRRQRFLRSLSRFMLDPGLTWLQTLDSHYVDQAHFVRDFRRFMTMNPSAYAALDRPVLRAAAQARAAATGAALQVLHRP